MLRSMEQVTASHDELLALVHEQAALIEAQRVTIMRLEARVRELESGDGPLRGMPGHKRAQADAVSRLPTPPRRKRSLNFARQRGVPTERIVHALEWCPTCGLRLAGGSVKRTREIIELPRIPASITEHVYLERCCPGCRERQTPAVALAGVVVGQSRLGVGLVSLIATLRAEARLPLRSIQRYLANVHGVHLSVGALVGALGQVANAGQTAYAALRANVRASGVVHGDETGWRENGHNGYVWTFSTADSCYFVHGRRTKAMVGQVLGDEACGVLVSDCYAAYDHYPGVQQKCWAHLLRDIHELCARDPADGAVADWAAAVTTLYQRAMTTTETLAGAAAETPARQQARRTLMADLAAVCAPFLSDEQAPQRVLCRRMDKHLASLFIFVLNPAVPSTNNAAERSLRHLVIARKISGGTRSQAGTTTGLVLASLFGTWRLRGLNPYDECRQLFLSPQA